VKIPRPDLAALGLCAIALLGIILLAALRIPVPEVLTFVALGALTGGAGIALNTPNGRETLPRSSTPAAATPPTPAPARAPYPQPEPALNGVVKAL
jgi:hypothetical protein